MKKMLISLMTILLIGLIMINIMAQNQELDDKEIEGRYRLPNNLVIEIFMQDELFYGKIIDVSDFQNGQTVDVKNPDKSKRNDSLMGKIIIKNLEYDHESGQWINGEMYSPDRGVWANLKIKSVNRDHLVAEGSKFLFSKTVVWNKIY